MTRGNKVFSAVNKYISTEKDAIKLQSALFDLRGGMMMDVSQANKIESSG